MLLYTDPILSRSIDTTLQIYFNHRSKFDRNDWNHQKTYVCY